MSPRLPPRWPARLAALSLLLLLPAVARPGLDAFKGSRHGDLAAGAFRDRKYRPGTCLQCHGSAESAASRGPRNTMALFAPNDDDLCLSCHKQPSGLFPGSGRISRSTHRESSQTVWPGPKPRARARTDAGRCVNCHDPHGSKDARGQIPGMLLARGDDLCIACHRPAGAGPDIATDLTKTSRHPRPAAPGQAAAGASAGPACADCHNPHLARRDPGAPSSGVSGLLDGVARVRPVNGLPGTPARLMVVPAEDQNPVREYEVCFRCHAGTAPAGAVTAGSAAVPSSALAARLDVATALNPANASFHPVEAQGHDTSVDAASFVPGWSASRLVTCSDCHGSDSGRTRGPHGSAYPSMLRKRYPVSSSGDAMRDTDLCFDCHAWGAYGPAGVGPAARASRYGGHASHTARGVSCRACHASHGSAALPSLLVLRPLGFVSYQRNPLGGTCTVSCHLQTPPTSTYRIAVPR